MRSDDGEIIDRYTCNVTFEAEEIAALRRLAEKNGGAYGTVIRWAVVEVERLQAEIERLQGIIDQAAKKKSTTFIPTIYADGRCNCSCADPCPLGRTGMTLRCTVEKLHKAGAEYKTINPNMKSETIKSISEAAEAAGKERDGGHSY